MSSPINPSAISPLTTLTLCALRRERESFYWQTRENRQRTTSTTNNNNNKHHLADTFLPGRKLTVLVFINWGWYEWPCFQSYTGNGWKSGLMRIFFFCRWKQVVSIFCLNKETRKNKVRLAAVFSSFFFKTHCSLFYRTCHLYFFQLPAHVQLDSAYRQLFKLQANLLCIKRNTKLATAADTREVLRLYIFFHDREILHVNINYCLHQSWINKRFDPRLVLLLFRISCVNRRAAANRAAWLNVSAAATTCPTLLEFPPSETDELTYSRSVQATEPQPSIIWRERKNNNNRTKTVLFPLGFLDNRTWRQVDASGRKCF